MSGILNSVYNNVSFAINLQTDAMTRLQEQASTGNRVNRSSDDPSSAYRILGLNSQGRSLESYIDNLTEVVSTLELSSTIVQDMISEILQVRTTIAQVTSGVYDEDSRKRTANAINDILEQMVSLANTKHGDQYLFGGSSTASAPYVAQYTDGKITSVTYQGSSEDRNINVAPGVDSSAFFIGDNIFRSNDRGEPVFSGGTGAQDGTGTSSINGYVWLTVRDNGSGGYELSIDDGATWVDAGSANQSLTDSRTGEVLYVDTTGINSTGVELVIVPGTHDIFNTLITIRDILENKRGLPVTQLQQLRDDSIASLEEMNNLLVQDSVTIGSRTGYLDNLKDSLDNLKYNTDDEVTRLQEADIAQISIDLSRYSVLYQASLSVASKLMSMSLLDFIE